MTSASVSMNAGAGVEAVGNPLEVSEVALSVEHVSKTYAPLSFLGMGRARARRRAVGALDDISFSVRAGDMIGLLGPNGAGKTTLLKIMTTLVHPSAGRVRLLGHDIREKARWTRRMIGLITCDERSFYWRLTGRHNLKFFAALYGVPEREADARMEELFDTLDLTSAADRPYHSYSSGMKQKLAIARGFIANPMVLFYDEPTRSLDPVSAQRIRKWIVERRRKHPHQTHIIATNHLYEAEQLCDRVVIIAHGRLLAQGSIRDICATWRVRDSATHIIVVRNWMPAGPLRAEPEAGLLEVSEERSGETTTLKMRAVRNSDALSRVLERVIRENGIVTSCESDLESFDEVFFDIVSGEPAGEDRMSATI